jgi:hypothetical protein
MVSPHPDTHVIGLSPREQFLVKLVLANLLAGHLDRTVQDASMLVDEAAITTKSNVTINLFNRYNDFLDLLCPESMIPRAKAKVLLLREPMMKYLVAAVNGYDPKSCYLGAEHKVMLVNTFEPLKAKVLSSANYKYSMQEIETAKK